MLSISFVAFPLPLSAACSDWFDASVIVLLSSLVAFPLPSSADCSDWFDKLLWLASVTSVRGVLHSAKYTT